MFNFLSRKAPTIPLNPQSPAIQKLMARAGNEACGICPSTLKYSGNISVHASCESTMNKMAIETLKIIKPGNRLLTEKEIEEKSKSLQPGAKELAEYHRNLRLVTAEAIEKMVGPQAAPTTPKGTAAPAPKRHLTPR